MRAFEPVIGRVAKQPRQAGELLDDVVNEAAIGVRGAERLAAPQGVYVLVNLPHLRQDDRVFHDAPPGTAIRPAVPINSAMTGVRHSLKRASGSLAGRRKKSASARSVVALGSACASTLTSQGESARLRRRPIRAAASRWTFL